MDTHCEISYDILKAIEICIEMLNQRGYIIESKAMDTILARKENESSNESSSYIIVFIADTSKLNIKNIEIYFSVMNKVKINNAIIIYKQSITSFTKRTIAQSTDYNFEIFAVEDLQFNITKHRLQPDFSLLDKKAAEEIRKKYKSNIPVLRQTDPISKFYAYKKGDVVCINRKNCVSYRIVK